MAATISRRALRVGGTMAALALLACCAQAQAPQGAIRGKIVEAGSGAPLPARLHIRSSDGAWHLAQSASPAGSAVTYKKERSPEVAEVHTTLSAHPFTTGPLKPGRYTLTVERGKEYLPLEKTIEVGQEPLEVTLELSRWIDMPARSWFSGDTHVHRTLAELPNAVLAEDVHVALPLTYWVTTSHRAPKAGDKNAAQEGNTPARPEPIHVDPTHVIYPVNTEYEIFSVGEKRHTLGAVFVLNHKTAFDEGAPPVGPIAARARQEGAILDLDKHSWPWSLMIVPVMKVDLFELTNNHVWRTNFGFPQWTREAAPPYMRLEYDAQGGFTEASWIDFGFQTYYALLNAGFKIRPSGGTASGVHPVPLGFGRVYVQTVDGGKPVFSYERWMQGLAAGRSFVTTGPMLLVEVEGQAPGATLAGAEKPGYRVTGTAESAVPLDRIEIVVNGRVAKTITPANTKTDRGGYTSPLDAEAPLAGSGWIAVRAYEARADKRVRFAHSSPVHVDIPGKPLRARRSEAEYLVRRMEEELARNRTVLKPEELQEYSAALGVYQKVLEQAIPDEK